MASDEAKPTEVTPEAVTGSTAVEPEQNGSTTTPVQIQQQTDELPSSTPVEMSHLSSNQKSVAVRSDENRPLATSTMAQIAPLDPGLLQPSTASGTDQPMSYSVSRDRKVSEAIGPSSEEALSAKTILQQTDSGPDGGPAVLVTLILLNGARHPFKIDLRYLRKRNIAKEDQHVDPYSISVYTVKELIWRDWREEWDPRPTIPGAIRLIHYGKLLDDKQTLKDCRFQPDTPNVVHMTVRPQEFIDEEEHAKLSKTSAGRRGRGRNPSGQPRPDDSGDAEGENETRVPGCCGCVIL